MKRLHKFLFFLFIASILMGHGFAEAQQSPAQAIRNQCRNYVNSKCPGANLRGRVPMSPVSLRNCNVQGYSGRGFTVQAFLSNEPAQKANTKPVANGKDKSVCNVVKKAHKACHVIVKKGKTVLSDIHKVFDSNGRSNDSCDLVRTQRKQNGRIAQNHNDSKKAERIKRSNENRRATNQNPRSQRLEDTRKRDVVTKDTTRRTVR